MSKNNRFIFKSLLLIYGFSFLGNTFPLYGKEKNSSGRSNLTLDGEEDEDNRGKRRENLWQVDIYEKSSQTQGETQNGAAQPALTTRGGGENEEDEEEFFDAEDEVGGGGGVEDAAAQEEARRAAALTTGEDGEDGQDEEFFDAVGEVGDTTAGEGGDTTAGEGEGGYCAIM
jgi:hypothetical protein